MKIPFRRTLNQTMKRWHIVVEFDVITDLDEKLYPQGFIKATNLASHVHSKLNELNRRIENFKITEKKQKGETTK